MSKVCKIKGCERLHWSKGWCSAHYQRWRKHGDPGDVIVLPACNVSDSQFCSIEHCEKIHYSQGYCTRHYRRWRLYGDPLVEKQRPFGMTLEELVEWLIEQSIETENGCFEFRRSVDADGYGNVGFQDKRRCRVNRLVLSFIYGRKLGRFEWALHRCHNPTCINPEHLYLGSPKENTQDMFKAGRTTLIGETHRQSKLTSQKVRAVRKYSDRLSIKFMANALGVSATTIRNVLNGKVWSHVT